MQPNHSPPCGSGFCGDGINSDRKIKTIGSEKKEIVNEY